MTGCASEDIIVNENTTLNDIDTLKDPINQAQELNNAEPEQVNEGKEEAETKEAEGFEPEQIEEEPEQQEIQSERERISEEKLEQLQFWFKEYKPPLKDVNAELLQLKGNLELDMDETCYPELREALKEYREQAREYSENTDYRVIVHRADKRVLSFLERRNEISGYKGFNFDPETGQTIELSDVVKDTGRLSAIIEEQLKYNYPDVVFGENMAEQINQLWGNDAAVTWTISYQGLCFYFSSEGLTVEAGDILQAMVFFENTPDLFQEKYLQAPEAYAIELDDYAPFLYDLDMDGGYDWIEVFHYQNDEKKDTGVQVNSQKCIGKYDGVNYFEKSRKVYLLHTTENRNYIVFYERGELDFTGEYGIYAIEKNEIKYLGCEDKNIYLGDGRITDLNAVRIESSADPIYMFLMEKDYSINENGFFEANNDPFYYCASYEFIFQVLVTLIDLEAPLVDVSTGDFLETEILVPQGTYMVPLRTDQCNWCDFLLADGQVCRIEFDEPVEYSAAMYKGMRVLGESMALEFYYMQENEN